MIGTIFNTCMILGGSILGSLLKKGMKEKYHEILMQALGLAVVALGLNTVVQHMPHSRYPVLFILSLAVGILILASGINILGLKKISIMNLLPSLLIPPIGLLFL